MSDSSQLAPRRSYARSALAPLLVFAIGILAAFLAASTTRDADREALRADLDADAAQLGLLIQSLANGLETDLTSTVGVALATGGDEAIYRARVDDGSGGDRALVRLGSAAEVVVAIDDEDDDAALAVEFSELVGQPMVDEELRSLADNGNFGILRLGDTEDGTRRLLLAAGASDGDEAFAEVRRFDLGSAGPVIVDLLDGIDDFAVYATDRPDPATAVLASTNDLPLEGQTAATTTDLGGRTLLLEVRGATESVVAPWLIGAVGAGLSALLAALLFVADRRRDRAVSALAAARSADEARATIEAELQRTQRMEAVGQLAGGVAHDFNNLLAAITSTVELLVDDVEDEQAREDLEEIRHAARRGASLTRRLLSFSRRDVEATELLDLNVVVDDVEPLLRRSVTADVTLDVRTSTEPIPVLGDAGEIEQVLLNLVVNARDAAAGPGHRIEVTTSISDGIAALIVHDTGTGMAPEVRDRAIEPFYSTKSKTEGTGLGLAIVYGIASRMGGSVAIDSALGEGTTVTVTFPAAAGEPEQAIDHEELTAGARPGRAGEVVLLVEDERSVRRATRRLLERAGHRVVDVPDGAEAITVVEDGLDPTVLLTDLVLPGSLNGRDIANRVAQMSPSTRIIYASGYPSEVMSNDDLVQADAAFLAKPFTSVALLDAVSGRTLTELAR